MHLRSIATTRMLCLNLCLGLFLGGAPALAHHGHNGHHHHDDDYYYIVDSYPDSCGIITGRLASPRNFGEKRWVDTRRFAVGGVPCHL